MNIDLVLKKLQDNEISIDEAFKDLYPEPKKRIGKRATFIKLKLFVPEEGKGFNRLFKIIFFLPFPVIFARMGIRFASRFVKDKNIDMAEISNMLKYAKHSQVHVDTEEAQIDIKII